MSNLFEDKQISPMLIGEVSDAFDNPDYIYEFKWDGERCVAYLDPSSYTELRNKRNVKMLPKVPELSAINKQVKKRCILDGELMVLKEGKPDFYEIQRRSLMSNAFRIELLSKQYPASFIAFDILFYNDMDLTLLPLMERKKYLAKAVVSESERLAVSRYFDEQGMALYTLAEQQGLEGIVAKRKDSIYIQGKRTHDWIKCKVMATDDCVICGYIRKANNMTSLILGQYDSKGNLIYRGHVTLGVSLRILSQYGYREIDNSPFDHTLAGNDEAVWLAPELVCVVESMPTEKDSFRQPVFKGIRMDKLPSECIAKEGG